MKKTASLLVLVFGLIELTRHLVLGMEYRFGLQAAFIHGTNLLLLILGLINLWLLQKSLANKNPHAFVRAVMGGMIIKMFFLLGGLVIFLMLSEIQPAKKTIIVALIIYFVYLIAEVTLAMKMNRRSNA